MVQADASRNYYADLGVSPSAGENEIRKAFRKLALQYHPDRNPGRETEVVTRFQLIQAAHEILTDPVQRAKYDQDRRKYRPSYTPSYSTNSPRARPPPPRNAYTTTTPSGSYYRAPPPQPPPQRPPPQQHHTTYTNGAERFTSKNFRPPPTAQRPNTRSADAEAKANDFTAWQKMKKPQGADPRAQTPNVNNPNGTPFGRSQSTRTPSKKGFDPATPGGDEGQARSSYRSSYARPAPSAPPTADQPKNSKDMREDDNVPNVPYTEGNRMRTPYTSKAGERTSMFGEGVGRSASARTSPTHRPAPSVDAGLHWRAAPNGQRNSYSGNPSTRFAQMYPSSSDEDSEADVFATRSRPAHKTSANQQQGRTPGPFGATPGPGRKPEATPKPFQSRSEENINMKFSPSDWHGKFEGNPSYFAPQKGTSATGRTSPSRGRPPQRTSTQRDPLSNRSQPPPPVSPFAVPDIPRMPPPPPPLNTHTAFPNGAASAPQSAKFAPEAWAESFKSSNWVVPPPPKFPAGATSGPQSVKFTQQAWAETFQSPSWAIPQPTKDTSPRRGSTSTKRPKAAARKPSAAPNAASTDTKTEGAKAKYQAFAEEAANEDGDVDAMDIDSNTPPAENPKSSQTKPDRTYQPGAPIQFSSNPARTAPSSPQNQKTSATGTSGTTPNKQATAPPAAAAAQPSPGLDGLGGLRNVVPLGPSTNGVGLSGLEELGDTLPFASKASSSHPTKPNIVQKLKFPAVPGAPEVPKVLNEPNVKSYLDLMERYVKNYLTYTKTMTNHLMSRHVDLESLDEHFILNRGETTKKWGFTSYMRKMKEDQEVLETFKLAHEMHLQAMQKCEEVRNKTLKTYATAAS